MNWSRRLGMIAVAVVAVVTPVLLASPASAATGPTGYTGCVRTDGSNQYSTYGTADSRTQMVQNYPDLVKLNTYATGRTYDCGPGGRAQSVPNLEVHVHYDISGSYLSCSVGTDGQNFSLSCSSDRRDIDADRTYTCHWVSTCEVSHTPLEATAFGGTVTRIYMKVTVTVSGTGGSRSTDSGVLGFQR